MKFTKEEAFEKLKGILTNSGKKTLRMSEISINRQLDTLLPLIATEEMELDDFVSKVQDTFSIMNSNAEKDNSDFVKDWEEKHRADSVAKKDDKDDKDKKDDKVDDPIMKSVLEKLEGLENELAESKRKNIISNKRSELEEAMAKRGIKDESWRHDFLDEVNITEDMDVDAKAESYVKIYNKVKADEGDADSTPFSSKGGNKDKEAHRWDYLKKSIKEDEERSKEVI